MLSLTPSSAEVLRLKPSVTYLVRRPVPVLVQEDALPVVALAVWHPKLVPSGGMWLTALRVLSRSDARRRLFLLSMCLIMKLMYPDVLLSISLLLLYATALSTGTLFALLLQVTGFTTAALLMPQVEMLPLIPMRYARLLLHAMATMGAVGLV